MATTTNLSTLKINYLTQAQYDALVQAGTVNADEIYLTPENGSVTETDPIFTQSPAYGITAQDIVDWDSKPSLITLLETGKKAFVLNVNGTTAMLIDYSSGSLATFSVFFNYYTNIEDCFIGQVINGASSINQAQARIYEVAELDMSTASVRLVSVDNGVIYTADLQDVGNGLTGTFSSQTIPTGGITTETDPVFTASPAHGITTNDISNWNGKVGRYTFTTSQNDPSEVFLYVAMGGNVRVTHIDNTYGTLVFNTWNISDALDIIVSNAVVYYNNAYMLVTLVGDTSGDQWNFSTTNLAQVTDIPTATSDLTNDSGFITTETDPTVPSWAKASTKPTYTASEVGALADTGGQVTGDITLYVASGNSPAIIFQRGTLTDNYNDWKIYDKSGFLYFAQRGNGSSAFGDVGYINTSGVAYFHVPWSYIDSKPTFATVATSGSYNDLSDKPTIPTGLPAVTSSDNGKVLRVVNGAWSAVALPSASGVSF